MLVPHDPAQMGIAFGKSTNDIESLLGREAHRLWLASRDDALRAGLVSPRDVLAHVVAQQQAWANSPHPDFDGLTPAEAVVQGRRGTLQAKRR